MLAEASGTERLLPTSSVPVLAILQMLSQHSDYCNWRGGKKKKGRSEMGGLKIKYLYMEGLLVPKLFFLSMAVPPSLFS